MMTKELLLFQMYLIYAGQSLAGFYSSGTRTFPRKDVFISPYCETLLREKEWIV